MSSSKKSSDDGGSSSKKRSRRDETREERRERHRREDKEARERRRRERKRPTGWDVMPAHGVAGMMPGMGGGVVMASGTEAQMARQRRRLFVGNMPPDVADSELRDIVNAALREKLSAELQSDDDLCVDASVNADKAFAFLEFGNERGCSTALQLGSIMVRGQQLLMNRPKDYVPPPPGSEAETGIRDGPHKLYVGGLPQALTEADARELLESIGPLAAFHLSRDPFTHASRGVAYCEFKDHTHTERAIQALHDMPIDSNKLVVKLASEMAPKIVPGVLIAQQQLAAQPPQPQRPRTNHPLLAQQPMPQEYPLFKPGDTVTRKWPAGIFLAPLPLPVLLSGIRGTEPHLDNQKQVSKSKSKSKTRDDGSDDGVKKEEPNSDDDDDDEAKSDEEKTILPLFDPLTSEHATRVVVLYNCVSPEELVLDEEFYDLLGDVRDKVQEFGEVKELRIPRRIEPDLNEEAKPAPPGTGRIFIEYAELDDARKAAATLGGKLFDGRRIIASFWDEEKFHNNDLGYPPVSAEAHMENMRAAERFRK